MSFHQCIFFVKAIISNLTGFISGTSTVHLFTRFCRSNIVASKTFFWARALKTEHAKLIV